MKYTHTPLHSANSVTGKLKNIVRMRITKYLHLNMLSTFFLVFVVFGYSLISSSSLVGNSLIYRRLEH